jgi:hypothetical protein
MMQLLTPIAALAALGLVASASAASGDLESRVTASDGWVAYRVPMVTGVDSPCCYSVHDGTATKKGCDLDGHSWSFAADHDDPAVALDGTLAMYFRVEHGRVERVRAVGASCPVHTEGTVRWIESIDPGNSVAMLSSLLDRKTADAENGSLVALAYHADASATRALAARVERSHPFKEREQALFWLGQTRGAEGADIVEHYATIDADPKLRAKAIFALAQSKTPDVYAHILTMAHDDPAEDVRGEAFFWLSHMDDARAKDDIIASLKTEGSDRVREQAVFALSQLHNGAADDALVAMLRGDYPRAVKKSALFWLGQSGTPQAMAYFDAVLK